MAHISYSELKIWNECPFKHKLIYIDKAKEFQGNEYTAFGRSIHSVCENLLKGSLREEDCDDFFDGMFDRELEQLGESYKKRENLITDMREQAKTLSPLILPQVDKYFGDYEVFSIEEKLFEEISDFLLDNFMFKGYIDLVLKTPDGKYHIIDWKSCSWGWDAKKRSDRMITYQLTLYKKFFCQKHNIDPKMVETHFALLKRTANKNNVEIFRVTSGPKKTTNACNLLNKALVHISKSNHVKNRLSCKGCEFYKTQKCP